MMKVHSIYISFLFAFTSLMAVAQVGVGTITPDPASVLDITATDKGILIPRVSLDDVTNNMIDTVNIVSEGMLLYNTNETVVGGAGVGFYFFNGTAWEKLNGVTPGSSDADWFVENTTNAPTSIDDDMYTNGNVAIGSTDANFPLSIETVTATTAFNIEVDTPGDDIQRAVTISMDNTGDGNQIGNYLNLNKVGEGNQYGAYNVLNGDTNGRKFGVYNSVSGNGDDVHVGVINSLTGNGGERKFGVSNSVNGAGDGWMYGVSNEISNSGDGWHIGVGNILSGNGNGSHMSVRNIMSGTGTGSHYGVVNQMDITSSANQFGVANFFSNIGTGNIYTVYNSISNDNDANHYGVYSSMSSDGDGTHYGSFKNINGLGNGTTYGDYTSINVDGTGVKYGNYITLSNSSMGDLYGVYSSVVRPSGTTYAAYFLGNVSIGTTAANSYVFPPSDGTTGQVMQTDGAGQLSWVTPTAPRPGVSSEVLTTIEDNSSQVAALTSEIEALKQIIAQQQEQLNTILEQLNSSDK